MQEKIDDRLNWLTQHLGGTGDKLVILTACLLHAGYFLLATLCILFLNAPLFARLVLLILVPINAWSEIKFNSSLSFGSLSCLLSLALLGKYYKHILCPTLEYIPPPPNIHSFFFSKWLSRPLYPFPLVVVFPLFIFSSPCLELVLFFRAFFRLQLSVRLASVVFFPTLYTNCRFPRVWHQF